MILPCILGSEWFTLQTISERTFQHDVNLISVSPSTKDTATVDIQTLFSKATSHINHHIQPFQNIRKMYLLLIHTFVLFYLWQVQKVQFLKSNNFFSQEILRSSHWEIWIWMVHSLTPRMRVAVFLLSSFHLMKHSHCCCLSIWKEIQNRHTFSDFTVHSRHWTTLLPLFFSLSTISKIHSSQCRGMSLLPQGCWEMTYDIQWPGLQSPNAGPQNSQDFQNHQTVTSNKCVVYMGQPL